MMKTGIMIAGIGVAIIASTVHAQHTYTGSGADLLDDNQTGIDLSIQVADSFEVTGVTVTLQWPGSATEGASIRDGHTWIGDLKASLTYDAGDGSAARSVMLFDRIGKTNVFSGYGMSADFTGSYTFADGGENLWDAANTAAAQSGSVLNATYEPSANGYADDMSASYQPVSLADAFAGVTSTGTWTLTLADQAGGDIGRLESWSLTLVPTPGAVSLIGLGVGVSMYRRRRA